MPLPIWQIVQATSGGVFGRERGRLVLATLAIALGTALGFAIELINRTAVGEFAAGMAALSGHADLEVRGPRSGFDEETFADVARLPGVAVASPIVEVEARLVGRDDTIRVFGIDALRAARVTPLLVGSSDRTLDLLDPGVVFVSPSAAREWALAAGERLVLQSGLGTVSLSIAGMTGAETNQRYAVMDIAAAQDAFHREGKITRIDVRVAPGTDRDALRMAIARALPAGVAVGEPSLAIDAMTRISRAYRVNLDVLALVALLTGALLVLSTQALAVTRRRAQFALLRTLGLSRARLCTLVIGEGAVIGAAGAVAGLPGGYLLARFALAHFGGDLGGGFFRGIEPTIAVDPIAAGIFAGLALCAAIAGGLLPAIDAARAAPAAALKPGDAESTAACFATPVPGIVLIVAGAACLFAPPIGGLPVFGYCAIALLLFGVLLLLPRIAGLLLAFSWRPHHAPAALAIDQLRGMRCQASISLAAIVASVSLFVSMAIMVASFRQSLEDWLDRLLPADMYVRAGLFAEAAYFSPGDQAKIAALPGVRRVEFTRAQSLLLDAALPRVTLLARNLEDPANRLPLVGDARPPAAGDPPALWITEPIRDLYGYQPGQRVDVPLAGHDVPFIVAGVWRDYARQQGALLIDRDRYVELTGDSDANEAALWLAPGAAADVVRREIEQRIGGADRLGIALPGDLRRLSLGVFDRTFAVTYALEAAAIVIGLSGLAASFGALALARRREFGMLRHLGMTRRQIGAMLATEGLAVSAIGLVTGLVLGGAISLILIYVVNRQSFHWSMDLHIPWLGLAGFSSLLVALGVATTLLAAREAMSVDAVRVVKDDW